MTPERLRQIEELYHAARERDPGQRAAFLAEACQKDEELRREVESLLASDASSSALLEAPMRRPQKYSRQSKATASTNSRQDGSWDPT